MIKTSDFSTVDSWALWNVPADLPANATDAEREQLFKAAYGAHGTSPKDQLPSDLTDRLSKVEYVLVGQNPGNAAAKASEQGLFNNFHGPARSCDYRLAAAIYGTKLWGTFMSDVSKAINSNSQEAKPVEADVRDFEKHLDALGISKNATLVALGSTVNTALTKFASRPVKTMYHYSPVNTRWQAANVRQQVLDITEEAVD